MVFAGGGFRFSYYLGMYAAAAECGQTPDVLLATCGGAIAAAIVHALPDNESRKRFAQSERMYDFLCRIKTRAELTASGVFLDVIKRYLSRANAKYIPDLFNDYLFSLPPEIPLPPQCNDSAVNTAIIGGRLLFSAAETGQLRGNRKLFMETVFGNERVVDLLQDLSCSVSSNDDCAISADLAVVTDASMADAVRVSIADMYYFPCHRVGKYDYTGGVIDLFPLEIAHRLADSVAMEFKNPFNQRLAIPALRSVFGFDGNQRMRNVHAQYADYWVDTSDVDTFVGSDFFGKKIDYLRNRLHLQAPPDYGQFCAQVERQWQYGYQRSLAAYSATIKNDRRHRHVRNRHNWGAQRG